MGIIKNLGRGRTSPDSAQFDPLKDDYKRLDVRPYNGSSYMCLSDDTPAGTDPAIDTTYWMLSAAKGENSYNTIYEHPRGVLEYTGNADYPTSGVVLGVGLQQEVISSGIITAISVPMWADSDFSGNVSIYVGSTEVVQGGATYINDDLFIQKTYYETGTFNSTSSDLISLKLRKPLNITTGQYIYVVAIPANGIISIKQWTTDEYADRAPLLLRTTSPANVWFGGSAGFWGTPLILIYDNNQDIQTVECPEFTMPEKIYVAEDYELNLWSDAISLNTKLDIESLCAYGEGKQRGFRYTPLLADVGSPEELTITATDASKRIIDLADIEIIPVSKTAGTGTQQVLFIGDSLTSSGDITQTFIDNVTADGGVALRLLGTKGIAPNLHEGISGWTYSQFIGAMSPFYIGGQIDLQAYMAVNSNFGGTNIINTVIIMLGINDIGFTSTPEATVNQVITNAKALIAEAIHVTRGYPNAKIVIVLTSIAGNTSDGFATDYGATFLMSDYRQNIKLLHRKLVGAFDRGYGGANVTVCASGYWVDQTYGYNRTLTDVSSRNSTQIAEHTNGVHTELSGSAQLADAAYSHWRGLIS